MDASAWVYYLKTERDLQQMLDRLHEQELAEQNYYWAVPEIPRPAPLAELHELYSDEESEALASAGTRSIPDIPTHDQRQSSGTYSAIQAATLRLSYRNETVSAPATTGSKGLQSRSHRCMDVVVPSEGADLASRGPFGGKRS